MYTHEVVMLYVHCICQHCWMWPHQSNTLVLCSEVCKKELLSCKTASGMCMYTKRLVVVVVDSCLDLARLTRTKAAMVYIRTFVCYCGEYVIHMRCNLKKWRVTARVDKGTHISCWIRTSVIFVHTASHLEWHFIERGLMWTSVVC